MISSTKIREEPNIPDFQFGLSTAQALTLSFRARSSIAGTFSGALSNSGYGRSYPFTFSLPTANAWTTISVIIPGDTAGTWLATNGVGVYVRFDMGTGTSLRGSAGSWAANNYCGVTGSASVQATASATFDLTAVQLEIGSAATTFEQRPYQFELAQCQRYREVLYMTIFGAGSAVGTTRAQITYPFKVTKRVAPTITLSAYSDWAFLNQAGNGYIPWTGNNSMSGYLDNLFLDLNCSGGGLTAGNAVTAIPNSGATASKIIADASL